MNNIIKTSQPFFELLLVSIFIIDIGSYFFDVNFITRYSPFILGSFFLYYIASRSMDFIYISLVLSLIFIICMLYNQDSSLNIITILINISMGWYLYLHNPRKNFYTILISLTGLLVGYRYISYQDVELVLASGSQNYLSVIFISLSILYYTFIPKKGDLVSLYPALVTLIFSVLATGRSGIASSMVLLFGIFFYNFFFIQKTKFSNFSYFLLAIVSLYYIYIFSEIIYNIDQPSSLLWRFSFGYENDGRLQILNQYLTDFSFMNFVFGRGNELILNTLDMSVHISFIQWHISLGFAAFFLYILVILSYFKMYKINKLYFILMTTILMRGATDHIMLSAGFIFGPLLVYYCMYIFFPDYPLTKHHHH